MIIPAAYLPHAEKKIDFDAEAATFLSGRFTLPDGFSLPSPPAGWYTLLELITSPFFLNPLKCSPYAVFSALALLEAGADGVVPADEFRRGNRAPLEAMADRFAVDHGKIVVEALDKVIAETLVIPFQGIDMLPQGDPVQKPFIFDAEFLSSLCASVAMTTGESVEYVMWKMPLLRAGYIRVFRARYEGEKGIGRKSDHAAVKAAIEEAKAREARGELQPWQIAEPHRYYPTERQRAARPEIMQEHLAALERKRNELQKR